MATDTDLPLERLRAIALALPEAVEQVTWEVDLTFRVRGRIFCSTRTGDHMGIKVPTEQLVALLEDPRIEPGGSWVRHGWVRVRLGPPVDWDAVAELVRGSYRLVAPKSLASLVD